MLADRRAAAGTGKPSHACRLSALLLLLCAGLQPVGGAGWVIGALGLLVHGMQQPHSIAWVAEHGHVDLVLAHAEASDHAHPHTPAGERDLHPSPDGEHVLHLSGDEDASNGSRRAALERGAALATALRISPPSRPAARLRLEPEPRWRSSAALETVVLRL